MALIYCSKCGKQISDKAPACPHCGMSRVPVNAGVQSNGSAQQAAAKSSNKTVIIVGAIVSVLIIALIVVLLIVFGGGNSSSQNNIPAVPISTEVNSYVPATEHVTDEAPVNRVYNVDLHLACEKNKVLNKYDVAILVDGRNLVTLPHGGADSYRLQLEEGSHSIEFRIASNDINGNSIYNKAEKGTYKEMFINVSGDMSVSYNIKLDYGNTIKVTQF